MTMGAARIEVTGLAHGFAAAEVLRGLDLTVRAGEIYALLGGNGAGKSTTLKILLGFIRPRAGSVRVCGLDPAGDPVAVRRLIAYVPENVTLYPHLSARENLAYLLRLAGGDAARVEEGLAAVGLPRDAWDRRLAGFSKGMQQKVAVALALVRDVPVLLLDEPTSGLDPQAAVEFNALVAAVRARGVAVLMVTHDLVGAAELADRIGLLRAGRIAAEVEARPEGDRFDLGALRRFFAAERVPA
jgi:ABC-2 type transport system ATP-binding protein